MDMYSILIAYASLKQQKKRPSLFKNVFSCIIVGEKYSFLILFMTITKKSPLFANSISNRCIWADLYFSNIICGRSSTRGVRGITPFFTWLGQRGNVSLDHPLPQFL